MKNLIFKTLVFLLVCSASYAQITTGYALVKSRKQPIYLPLEDVIKYNDTTFTPNKDLYPIRKNVIFSSANAIYRQSPTTITLYVFSNGGLPNLNQISDLEKAPKRKNNSYQRERFIYHEPDSTSGLSKTVIVDKGQTSVFRGSFNSSAFYTITLPLVHLATKDTAYHYRSLLEENVLYDRIYSISEPLSTSMTLNQRQVTVINSNLIRTFWKGTLPQTSASNFYTSSNTLKIDNLGRIQLNLSDSTRAITNISQMLNNNGKDSIDADLVTYNLAGRPYKYGTLVRLKYIGKKLNTYPRNKSYEVLMGNNWLRTSDSLYLDINPTCSLSSISRTMVLPLVNDFPFNGCETMGSLVADCPCPDEPCGRPPR